MKKKEDGESIAPKSQLMKKIGMGSGSRLASATATIGIVDLVDDLCAIAIAMSFTNGVGDTALHTIIPKLSKNTYEK